MPVFGAIIPTLIASVAIAAAANAAVQFVFKALGIGPKAKKTPTTETAQKIPVPPRVRGFGRRLLYGSSALFETASDGATVDVWSFHDRRVEAVIEVYLNDKIETLTGGVIQEGDDGRYGDGKVKAGYNLGLPTETAFAAVIAKLPGIWTSDHRGDGVVTGYLIKEAVKDKHFLETYPQGDSVNLGLVMDLQWIFDPRDVGHDPYDPTTWSYSNNAPLCLLTYLILDRGYDYDRSILPEIDSWIAAADDADESQSLDAGGSEARYRCCVVYEATDRPADVISEILATFDGWYAPNEIGALVCYSGRYYEPTVDIGPNEIVSYTHIAFVEDEEAVNELAVTYVSDQHNYNVVEAQAWRDDADIAARGRVNSQGFGAQVPSFTQGRRLAKRKMLRTNAPDRGTVKTNFSGRAVLGQRFINLRVEEAGAVFYDGPAEITSAEKDLQTGGVVFEWVAADPDVDDWNPAADDGVGATAGDSVTPTTLAAPVITSATYLPAGTDGARIRIVVSAPDRDDLTWFASWRVDGDTIWNEQEYPDLDPGASVTIETVLVPFEAEIEVMVQYRIGDGRFSPDSNIETVGTIPGITADSDTVTADDTTHTADEA